jgi:hypothetical protein
MTGSFRGPSYPGDTCAYSYPIARQPRSPFSNIRAQAGRPDLRFSQPRAALREGAHADVSSLRWLEKVLQRDRNSGGESLVGAACTSVDLSAFQIGEGLRYAFPHAMTRLDLEIPRVVSLRDRVAAEGVWPGCLPGLAQSRVPSLIPIIPATILSESPDSIVADNVMWH